MVDKSTIGVRLRTTRKDLLHAIVLSFVVILYKSCTRNQYFGFFSPFSQLKFGLF